MLIVALVLSSISAFVASSNVVIIARGPAPPVTAIEWGSLVQPQNATPGDINIPLFVVVRAFAIGASIESMEYQPFGQQFVAIPGYILSANSTQSIIVFYLTIPQNVSPGLYKVFLGVNYTYDGGVVESSQEIPIYISPVVYPKVTFEWGNGNFVSPGEGLSPLTVIVENPSSKIDSNVMVSVDLPKGVYSLSGNQVVNFTIPAVQPFSVVSSTQMVNVSSSVSPGYYKVNYTITFTDQLGGVHSKTFNNGSIFIYPKQPLTVKTDPILLYPGKITSLTVYLNSSGVQLTSFNVESQNIIISSYNITTPISFEGVLPIQVNLYAPYGTTPGVYPVTISGSYTYGGVEYTFSVPEYVEIDLNESGPEVVSINWLTPPYPGSSAQGELTVFNPLPYPVYSLNISTTSLPLSQPYYTLPEIPPFGSSQVEVEFIIPKDAEPIYHLTFMINYFTEYGRYSSISSIITPIYSQPLLSVKLYPNTVVQGQQTQVVLYLKDLSNQSLYDIHVSAVFSGVQLVGSSNNTIYELEPSSTSPLAFSIYVPSYLATGVYPVEVSVEYYYSGIQNTQTFTIPLIVTQAENGVAVTVSPSTLYYQVSQQVKIVVSNNGNSTLTDLNLKIYSNPQVLSLSQTQFNLQILPPHENYTFTVNAFSPISSTAVAPLSVSLQYQTQDGLVTYNENFSIMITGLISIEVLQPSLTLVNNSEIFQATLLNEGNTQANNVIVYYPGGSSYIGQLPTASPLPISITLPFDEPNVSIVISYQTPTYQTVNMTYSYHGTITTISVPTSQPSHHKFSGIALVLVIIIVVAIILFLVLKKVRRHESS